MFIYNLIYLRFRVNIHTTKRTEDKEMTQQELSKRAADYLRRIENCEDRNEIEGIRIEFSEDCSAYRLSWEDFMVLYKAQQAKRKEIRSKR